MLIDMKTEGFRTTIALNGQFVFDTHRNFRSVADRSLLEPGQEINVDLANVSHIDSAGLGMLLLLKDKARNAGKQVVLSNSHGDTKQLLDIARIDSMLAAD